MLFRLYELREKLKEVEVDVARERHERELMRIAAQTHAQRNDAARRIQRSWRAFLARRTLAAKRRAAQAKAKKTADAKKGGKKVAKGETKEKGVSPAKRPSTSTAKKSVAKK